MPLQRKRLCEIGTKGFFPDRTLQVKQKQVESLHFSVLKRPSQKSLPSSFFLREESIGGILGGRFPHFPLWKKGRKGDFTAFQKTKLLRRIKKEDLWRESLRKPTRAGFQLSARNMKIGSRRLDRS
jgi:hypothetical protein